MNLLTMNAVSCIVMAFLGRTIPLRPLHTVSTRLDRYKPFTANFDPEHLEEAREWRQKFTETSIPKGDVTYSRSSGPGGQHVNKTESKVKTSWSVQALMGIVPIMLKGQLRESKYYTVESDSLAFQAQTSRDREANAQENRRKLVEELLRIYDKTVPGEESEEKAAKHEKVAKEFHAKRLRTKGKRSRIKEGRNKQYDL